MTANGNSNARTVCVHLSGGGDKTIGWTPGSTGITYGAKAVCTLNAVCVASEFAPRMASLLADRNARHRLVLFLRGQSGSGKTWLTRKLLEPLEGAQISITSIEDGASKRTIPQAKDNGPTVKLTKRLLDVVARWSRTAKTSMNKSSSRAVVACRMDGLPLIDIPGGEEETRKIHVGYTRSFPQYRDGLVLFLRQPSRAVPLKNLEEPRSLFVCRHGVA
ncbi:hypothetical protein FN846DRAFT_886199 [Sphaerosporella brunnea]|uniref:P-loop containing nucleoside triphosphate hydrolase protein n=1 Tax=Sphaerosporella brunnea TaxID=1250544 RepID=A0A5J5F9L2_9PEZI|nr:hypothetical protein FN846DRAFT_886199 [Sphaerosporella brunnea]